MFMDFSTPKRGKNIFEFVYSLVAARRDKDAAVVQCVNQQNIIVEPLDPYRPFLRFDSLKNKLIGFIFVIAVILADEKFMSIIYKVWLVSLVSLVYLLYSDYKRIPIRYVHPSRFDHGEFHEEESQYNRTISLEEEQVIKEFISVSQCEFHILQVKVIDHNDGLSHTGLHAPVAGSKAIFQITIICGRSRWEVWRKYEHFCKVYDNLCTKYTNHKIAKLPTLESIKQTWRQMSINAGESGETFGGEEEVPDDTIFLGHSFLQKLQAEMLGWLRTMQLDPIGDDTSLRALLKLPAYKARPVTSGLNTASALPHHSGRPASVSSRTSGRSTHNHITTTATSAHPHKHSIHPTSIPSSSSDNNTTDTTEPTTYTTLDGQTGTVEPSTITPIKTSLSTTTPQNIDPITGLEITAGGNVYISPCGCWKGNTVETFQWLDMDQKARDMYIDIKYSHDFKVRGATYLTDKKKVDAGPSISRLIMMENFHVNTAKYGDRLDHICQIGRVKRRVEIMHNLPGNPFVLVLNLQIPGDPPVSIVFYFLVPTTFYPGTNPSDGLDATREMFRKLIDCPITPPVEENQAYLDEVNELGLGRVRQDSDEPDKKDATRKKGSKLSETKNKSSFYVPAAPKSWTADVVWPDLSKGPQPGVLSRDSFQNKRFKLIPSMVEAPWVVQMAVSSTPVLLGQKVVQRYFRGEGYIEMDVHIGSSAIADNIVGVCRSYSKAFICNLGIVLQGETEEELPEHVLACAALKYCDVDVFSPLESYNF